MPNSSQIQNSLSFLWELILDLFFPRFEIKDLTTNSNWHEIESQSAIDVTQNYDFQNYVRVIAATDYDKIKTVIYRFKYRFEKYLGSKLAQILVSKVGNLLNANELLLPDLITFVPPDPKRLAQRGFNSPEILARYLGQKLNFPVEAVFEKKNHTKAQAGMNKIERLQNLDDVFELGSEIKNVDLTKIKYLWLIDDVIASGTTVEKLIQVLNTSFPRIEVTVIVLARNLEG